MIISIEPIMVYYSTRLFSVYANSIMTAVITDAEVVLLVTIKGSAFILVPKHIVIFPSNKMLIHVHVRTSMETVQ